MRVFLILVFGLFLGMQVNAQIYTPIALSGFNEDVIAEGTGASAILTTTREMDAVPISNFVMCTKEFADANNFTPSNLYGLPNDGLLTAGQKTFQIAPYDGNNVSYLLTQETVVLNLNTPAAYTNISLLGLSTEGSSSFTVTFRFADNTNQTSTQNMSDWFANPSSPFKGYGRVKRIDGPFVAGSDYEAAPAGNPALTAIDFAVPCTKILTSIEIKNVSSTIPQSGSNRAFIFAVSGFASVIPSVSILASQLHVCAGTPITFTATPTNGGTVPVYEWRVNGQVSGGNSSIFTSSTLIDTSIVTCSMTSNASCVAPAMVTSNLVSIVVDPKRTPTITMSVSDTAICEGEPVRFSVKSTNGGATPNFQWQLNGQNTGVGDTTITFHDSDSGDVVKCILTSSETCITIDTATTLQVKLHVTPVYDIVITQIDSLFPVTQPVVLQAIPTGGIFSGMGIHENMFHPDSAGVGAHVVRYILPANNCTSPDSILIIVKPFPIIPDPLPCALDPITLITPNDDGKNDFWDIGIFNAECITKANVEIFNRWGKSVYKADNYANDWNGKSDEKALNDGTYFFTINYATTTSQGSFIKSGFLTINH